MCSKEFLYSPSTTTQTLRIVKKPRGGSLTFQQICYVTECLLAYADSCGVTLADAAKYMTSKSGSFQYIYKKARLNIRVTPNKMAEILISEFGKCEKYEE